MQEINTNIKNFQECHIKVDFLSSLKQGLLLYINGFLNFLGLKETKQFWGIVYDSTTKQPLDPVIVKMMYVDGREVKTSITDMSGRYGFLAKPGKFKIFAKKTNYSFPSKIVSGDKDGIFENVYHGEFFQLSDESEVVAPNIPMDPESLDWNQKAKLKVVNTHPFFKIFFRKLILTAFVFGLLFSASYAFVYYPKVPNYLYLIAGFYAIVFVLLSLTPETRLWGQVEFINFELQEGKALFLELHKEKLGKISFGKTDVHDDGRFLLRANKGKYTLCLKVVGKDLSVAELGTIPVTVSTLGILNSKIKIKGI